MESEIQITFYTVSLNGDKPENISIDSVALPFEALRIKKGFILEIYNVEWNEYLPLNI